MKASGGEKIESKEEFILRRRLARQAKREKERLASVNRAAKMRELRLHTVQSEVKEFFPVQQFHVGCSGWFYWHLRGTFYAQELPQSSWFAHYASIFDTVELNAPFYSWPTVATVKTWLRQVELVPHFVYTVKVSELITHIKKFEETQELVLDFGVIADLLGNRFGCFLFQLPPSFTFTSERLDTIVGQLDPTRRNVVEFRHKSWWNDTVYEAFRKKNIIFCSCSGPRLPDELINLGMRSFYKDKHTSCFTDNSFVAAFATARAFVSTGLISPANSG